MIHPDPRQAWTLPSRYYTDPSVYEQSRERIFARSWHLAMDLDRVKIPGAAEPFHLLDGMLEEPLVMTRDREDQLHCLSNVCTHRGATVCEGSSSGNTLRCRYHGRRFGLDGKCQFMPEFDEVVGFPAPSDDLPRIPFGVWRRWVFASFEPVLSLVEKFSEVERRVGWMPIQDFQFAPNRARDYLVKAHWALYVDNYLEGFHIPYIHAGLNQTLDYGRYRTELFDGGNLQVGFASDGETSFNLPVESPDHGEKIAAYYYWLYPNLMLNFYPWGLSINIIKPLRHDLTRVSFLPYVWDESLIQDGAGSILDRVEREDEVVVEQVQRGLRSRFYDRGRYSPEREKGVHQFHRLLLGDLGE